MGIWWSEVEEVMGIKEPQDRFDPLSSIKQAGRKAKAPVATGALNIILSLLIPIPIAIGTV